MDVAATLAVEMSLGKVPAASMAIVPAGMAVDVALLHHHRSSWVVLVVSGGLHVNSAGAGGQASEQNTGAKTGALASRAQETEEVSC